MSEVHGENSYSWGRAVGGNPSALGFDGDDFEGAKPWRSIYLKEVIAFVLDDLREYVLNRRMDVHPLTPKEIVAIEDFIRGLDWVLWSAVMVGRGFEWRKDWMSRVGDAVNEWDTGNRSL
jgi:hypothetical protein